MATKLLCCVALCLLGVGPTDAGVTQTPRHEVTEKGQAVTLSCEPIKSHTALYWYRQTSVRGLELLIYFNNQASIDESGMPKDRFSAKMHNASFSTLKIQPTDPGDSATYLCASSKDTALQSCPVPSRKPLFPLPAQPLASSAVFLGSSPSSPAVQLSMTLGKARIE
uniref:Ig-like domain-containing protein n=1 Tax=Bos indicus x Bos taurus TaxID=30522 RepID=A0A4W2FFE4_BOBOX